jgi:hypothetical protein
MTNFAVYMIGVVVAVCAIAYGAHLVGVSSQWIGVGVAVLIGLGIMGAIVKTRRPQSS